MPRQHRLALAPSLRRAGGLSRVLGAATTLAVMLGAAKAQAAGTAKITGLSDISFSALNPFAAAQSNESLCVGSSSGLYTVTATGSGSGSAFLLSAGGGLTLAYAVAWSPTNGATSGVALTPAVALTNQSTSSLTGVCLTSPTASVIVSLSPSNLQAASAGVTYTGTLTLVVAAQ